MILQRGEIYRVNFKMFFDKYIPEGKPKYVLVLQDGIIFARFPSVQVVLITSDKKHKPHEDYTTDVEIEVGSTDLPLKSWALCAQLYPLAKSVFEEDGVICAGKLSDKKMDEIDEALYNGLCMGLQEELEKEDSLIGGFGKFLLGAVVGAGIATYAKNRENQEKPKDDTTATASTNNNV